MQHTSVFEVLGPYASIPSQPLHTVRLLQEAASTRTDWEPSGEAALEAGDKLKILKGDKRARQKTQLANVLPYATPVLFSVRCSLHPSTTVFGVWQ